MANTKELIRKNSNTNILAIYITCDEIKKLSKDKEHIYDVGEDYREGERIVGEIKRAIKEFYENTRKNKSSPLKELSIAS